MEMGKLRQIFSLPLYIMMHPAAGFYAMKYEKEGSRLIVVLNVFLFWISYTFQKQYSGFAVNENNPFSFNCITDLLVVLGVYFLFCAANWSVTTLMEGEGSFKDISMALSYSLTPMILTFIPASILSNFLVSGEKEFYFLLMGISIAWFAVMLFMGIYTVHNYTVTKTIVTFFLTFIAILIIIFITGLIASLVQQMYIFIRSIYTEIVYRL